MSDAQFEEWLRETADGYNRPAGEVPRDAMWDAIAATRAATARDDIAARTARRSTERLWRLAAAAVLLIAGGAGIGYWARGDASRTNVVAGLPDTTGLAASGTSAERTTSNYSVAASAHFTAAEALLVSFRAVDDASLAAGMRRWARDLLSTTRLLMDSPASADPQRRKLLEDLELILVQIVQLAPDATASDRAVVDRAISSEQVLTRIRTSIPAGSPSGS